MPPEDELLAKLEEWLAAREEPPTVFDVIETGDGELLAAFILKGFRTAARQAVVDRLAGEATTAFADLSNATSAVLRVFDGLAGAWSLEGSQRLALLGLAETAELQALRTAPLDEVPTEIVERVIILLDIFKAINTLLPEPSRADAWIRTPNSAPLFAGRPALDMMIDEGLEGLRRIRSYLQAQI